MALRDELLAEVGPRTHIADLCGRASDELLIKQMKIDQQQREIGRLRICLQKIMAEVGTSTLAWHLANDAMRGRSEPGEQSDG